MSSDNAFLGLDLDGTLIDAKRRQVAVTNACIEALGLKPLVGEEFWWLKREGLDTRAVLECLGYAPPEALEVARQWMVEIEAPRWLKLDAWLPRARESLAWLRQEGIPVRILTARAQKCSVERQCGQLGLLEWVEALEVVEPAEASTAKARLLKGALAFVGDTESDARAAALATVPFLGVTTGQRSRDFLASRGVMALYDDLISAVSSQRWPNRCSRK